MASLGARPRGNFQGDLDTLAAVALHQIDVKGSIDGAAPSQMKIEEGPHKEDSYRRQSVSSGDGLPLARRCKSKFPTGGDVASHGAGDVSHFQELLQRLAKEHEHQLQIARGMSRQLPKALHKQERPELDSSHDRAEQSWSLHEALNGDPQSFEQAANGQVSKGRSVNREISVRSVKSTSSGERSPSRKKRIHSMGNFELLMEWKQNITKKIHMQRSSSRTSGLIAAVDRMKGDMLQTIEPSCWPLRRLVVHPNSMTHLAWDLVGMILLVFDIITIPFIACFQPEEDLTMVVLNYGICIFWSIDMVLVFLTGYTVGKDNVIVLNHKKIAIRYFKSWFFIDLTVVSLDWVLVVLRQGTSGSVMRLGRSLRTLRFVRTLRLLRVVKLKKIIQIVQDEISSEGVAICVGVLQVVFWLLVSNHIVACCWYGVGSIKGEGLIDGWVVTKQMESRSLVYRYATSLHWSLAQFTPAPNEIFPQNVYERVFATAILVFAMVAFSSFVSSLTTAMMQLRNLMSSETRHFWLLRRYLRDWKVRPQIKNRILRYLEYAYQRHQQKVQEKDVKLLGLLSRPLQEELRQDTLKVHLFTHALFSDCRLHVRTFSKALSASWFAPADRFFECGEQAVEMLFLASGEMEYYLGDLEGQAHLDEKILVGGSLSSITGHTILSDYTEATQEDADIVVTGEWVCEPVLWTSWAHLGDLFALTECQIVAVDATGFANSVRTNLLLWQYMQLYADSFMKRLNSTDYEELTDLMHRVFDPKNTECLHKNDWAHFDSEEDTSSVRRFVGQAVKFMCCQAKTDKKTKPHGSNSAEANGGEQSPISFMNSA